MAKKTKGRYKSPNDEIRCAGTLDYKGYLRKLGDDIWILDWKSAKDDYPEYRMQTAKYREMDGEATRNGIVLLDKETGFPRFIDHSDTYEQDIERFNLLLEYWYLTYSDRLKDGYVPSPTEVLGILDKPALIWWAVNCYRDYMFEESPKIEETVWIENKAYPRDENGMPTCYITDKVIFPSKLHPLIEDGRKNFRQVSQKALDIGSAIHDLIPAYLMSGVEPKIEQEAILSAFIAFLEFKEEYGLEPIDLEKTVYK